MYMTTKTTARTKTAKNDTDDPSTPAGRAKIYQRENFYLEFPGSQCYAGSFMGPVASFNSMPEELIDG